MQRPEGLEPAERVLAEARRLAAITTQEEADSAGLFLQAARKKQTQIEDHYDRIAFKPMKRAYDGQRAEVRADMVQVLEPLQEADRILTQAIERWLKDQKALAQRTSEAQLQAATDTAAAERQQQVDELQRAGLTEQAEAVAAQPLRPVVTAVAAPVGVAGMTLRSKKHVEVRDFGALFAAVCGGQITPDALLANVPWLDALLVMQGELFAVPGCVVVEDDSLAAKPQRG